MPTITQYTSLNSLPAEYECQMRAYIRFLWHDEYVYNLDLPLIPPERHPQFVVMAEQHALISAARITWVTVTHAREKFKMYCLGDVFTYPAFRQKGYGSQVVKTATDLIRADPSADAAILFTDPELERFYAQHGWQHVPQLKATIGFEDSPDEYGGFAMMLFLSDKAKSARTVFEEGTVHLPGYSW